ASGAASPFVRAAARSLHLANRLGLAQPFLRHRLTVVTDAPDRHETRLHEFLGEVLGCTNFVTSMRIAPRRPNGKPVVQAIANDGTVLAYAKFGWETLTRQLVRHEAEALDDLAGLTKGSLLKVPRVLFSGAWRGIEAIVLDPLVGQRLRPRSVADMPVGAAIALAQLRQRRLAELGDSAFWRRSTAQLERVMTSLDEQGREVLVTARNEIEDRWGGASLPMGQCHGDWIPPNMSVARDGSYNLWDWELSDGDTPLGIDTMHFILQMELRSSRSAPATARRLCRFGREALLRMGLDPKQTPLLVALNLLRMNILYGEARRVAQAKDGDHRYTRVLQAVVARF
ncbi:MAG TPA: hypothetical protein VIR45_07105, partial [Kiloniellaceae bacterium]